MIYVIATIQVRPQAREPMLRELAAITPEVRQEDGCLEYRAAVDLSSGLPRQVPMRPDVVSVIESWRDFAALNLHLTAPHMTQFRKRIADLVISTSLQILEATDSEG